MKKYLLTSFTLIVFAVLFAFTINVKKKGSIQGAWILVEGKQVTNDGVTKYPASPTAMHMKIISENHFATIAQDANDAESDFLNGGSYALQDDIYIEDLTFFSFRNMIGTKGHFKVKIEGDRLHMDACDENGKVSKTGIFEIWERAVVE